MNKFVLKIRLLISAIKSDESPINEGVTSLTPEQNAANIYFLREKRLYYKNYHGLVFACPYKSGQPRFNRHDRLVNEYPLEQ